MQNIDKKFTDKYFRLLIELCCRNDLVSKLLSRLVLLKLLLKGEIDLSFFLEFSRPGPKDNKAYFICLFSQYFPQYSKALLEDKFILNSRKFSYPDKVSPLDPYILAYQIFFNDQYDARKFIKEDSIVIDVGANYGIFSVLAASLAKNGKVFSFEPTNKTFNVLQKNLRAFPQAEAINLGLSDKKTESELIVFKNAHIANYIISNNNMYHLEKNSKDRK